MIELDEIMRQRGDYRFTELLCRVRTNECTPEDIDILKSRVILHDSPNYPMSALHVYRLNNDVDSRNIFMLNSIASEDQQYSINACDSIGGQTNHIELSNISDKRSDTGGLHSVLKLAIGARVMLTANVDVSDGLVNGARGEVVHIVKGNDDKVIKVLVKFADLNVGLKAIQCSQYHRAAVPISKHEVIFLAQGKRGSEVTRVQFPLTLSWATTIHKVQGLTLDEIVVDMKGGHFSPGQAYVAFSRVKALGGLYLLNFDAKVIKASEKVHKEMCRLKTKELPIVSQHQLFSLFDTHLIISLLNVRSITAKFSDILNDLCLSCAHVSCFCETWLSPSHSSPNLGDNYITIRSDRTNDNHKGGVLISVLESLYPSHRLSLNFLGIESVITTLTLPNSNCLNIYRSPSCSIDILINALTTILNNVPQTNPSVILGDFNDNVLNKQTKFLQFMSRKGYTQLVSTPTTDRGTLIDHVYYNQSVQNWIVEVNDTYYSDHDTVYCAIPLYL